MNNIYTDIFVLDQYLGYSLLAFNHKNLRKINKAQESIRSDLSLFANKATISRDRNIQELISALEVLELVALGPANSDSIAFRGDGTTQQLTF